jgi:hypothetical protein
VSKLIVLFGMGECDYRREQETHLYKLLGQISSRKCGSVGAEIGSPIFRGAGEQTAHACANACLQQVAKVNRYNAAKMLRQFRGTIRTAYAFAIIVVSLVVSAAVFVFGWRERTHSRANVVFSLLVGGFFLYAAVVLVFQTIEDWKYRRALDALGFLPFDWTKVPFQQVLSGFSKGGKAFVSRGFQGTIGSTDVYVFNFGTDTAWWSMRKIAAVLPNAGKLEQTEHHELLLRNADAELTISPEWFVVRSRRHVSPDTFQQWVRTVVATLASGRLA